MGVGEKLKAPGCVGARMSVVLAIRRSFPRRSLKQGIRPFYPLLFRSPAHSYTRLDHELASPAALRSLAERTEGYSGADLQALLYNAQLEAIHDAIEARGGDGDAVASSREAEASPLSAEQTAQLRAALDHREVDLLVEA